MSQTDHTAPSQEKKRPAEMTIAAVSLGIILSIVMGAANVYLGLVTVHGVTFNRLGAG